MLTLLRFYCDLKAVTSELHPYSGQERYLPVHAPCKHLGAAAPPGQHALAVKFIFDYSDKNLHMCT